MQFDVKVWLGEIGPYCESGTAISIYTCSKIGTMKLQSNLGPSTILGPNSNLVLGMKTLMPRSHIHGTPRRFHYGSDPTDDPGNDNFRSPTQMHNASTTTYDYGCYMEVYGHG